MPLRRPNIGCRTYFTENNINVDSIFQIMFRDDFARTLANDKVPGGTTWNQVTKQETVVEREKKRRSGQS